MTQAGNIHRNMNVEFHLNIDGSNSEIFNALRSDHLKFAYDQFLDSRWIMDEEDPDTVSGKITVKTIQELYDVLTALLGKLGDITLWAVGETSQTIGGQPECRFSAGLPDEFHSKNKPQSELFIDESSLSITMAAEVRKAAKILQAALNK